MCGIYIYKVLDGVRVRCVCAGVCCVSYYYKIIFFRAGLPAGAGVCMQAGGCDPEKNLTAGGVCTPAGAVCLRCAVYQ